MKAWLGPLLASLIVPAAVEGQRARLKMEAVPVGDPAEWFPEEEYPADAVKAGRQGRVSTLIGIDSSGRVVSCEIDVSSGTTSLDLKACELLKARARFDPATDRKGRPIASTQKRGVRWILPDQPGQKVIAIDQPAEIVTEVTWVLDAQGVVESCSVTGFSAGVESCKKLPVGAQADARFTVKGEPVRAVVRERYTRTMEVPALPK